MLTMRENSILWIGSRACSHKNGIFDWVVVFVSFNTKRKKEFQAMINLQSKLKTSFKCVRFYNLVFIYFMSLLSFFIAKKKDHEVAAKLPKEKASATMRLLFTELNKFLRVCFFYLYR